MWHWYWSLAKLKSIYQKPLTIKSGAFFIMSNEHYKKLGTEKPKALEKDFDKIVQTYQEKAISMGYMGELKFVKERGRVIIYVAIWNIGNTHH